MNSVKAVLFDVGGVLVELDGMPSLAEDMGVDFEASAIHDRWMNSEWVIKHETGRAGTTDFAAGVVDELKLEVSSDRFLESFSHWPKRLLPNCNEVLREVADCVRAAALSNMSQLHWNRICELGLEQHRFEQTFVSYETGVLKPSPLAYELASHRLELRSEEIVFVDDSKANVEAASTTGMRGIPVTSPSDVRRELVEIGVLA